MKNIRYTFAALFLLLTVSCAKEVIEPDQMLTGKYVLEDGSGLCGDYISFEGGYCEYHITKDMTDRTFAEQTYWKCNPEDFKLRSRAPYSLFAGELTFWGNFLFSSGSVKDGVLHLDGKAFTSLKAFRDEYWSSLSLPDGPAKTLDYTGQEVSIPVVVTRPIPAGKYTIRAGADWISRPRMEEGNLIFHVPETKSDATAQITLGYTNAAPLTLTVTRTPSTAIILEESERTVGYAESSQQFPYRIDNPLPESFLLVTSDAAWVQNIQSENGVLSFDIAENNSGKSRTATLTLSYSGARDVTFLLTQSWSASEITLTPESQSVTYTGGAFSFDFEVNNPREGAIVTAQSQVSWITDVVVNGNKVSYKVAENNSGASRSGKIRLTYGSFATKDFAVTQSWSASEIALTPDSQSVTYTGGSFSFDFEVTNPREGASVTAQSQTSWITDVVVNGNKVSYKVAENNSGASRSGKIRLTYGNFATKDFAVTQSWSASEITVTPESQSVTYTGGAFSFDFDVTHPREGASVTAQSQASWITDVVVNGNKVSYKVAENNSYFSRTGKLSLIYGSYATKDFDLNQSSHPITNFSLNKSELNLLSGNSENLHVTTFPEDVSLIWSSNNTTVATVSQNGMITAVGNGTAIITVISSDNNSRATCAVTVTTAVENITLDITSLEMGAGESEFLIANITPTTASNKRIIWSSSNPTVANVDQYGLVTAKSPGSSIVTVTTVDGNKSATCNLTVHEIIDLSSIETANSYIISQSGWYKIKTVKGNSSQSVGSVASSEVLWESLGTATTPSVGDVVSDAYYRDGYIRIIIPQNMKNGNVVIAAKDASGNILWSWHIWVCEGYEPAATAQEYYNNAGVMMDRNLGATSAIPGDVGALGLLYQWGRKDPFLGSSSISSNTRANSTLSWPSPVSSTSSNGTITYATAHPTTFITYNSSNNDWYYTGSSSTDNTRWQSSKTIYDPCPPGWRVPDGGGNGVWSKAVGSSSSFVRTYDSTKEGINFSGKFGSASTIWYPAAGCLNSSDGGLYGVGSNGYWWSCTPDGNLAYYLRLLLNGNVYPSGTNYRSSGRSVRCLQE